MASYIVLLSAVCVDIVKPATGSKKKKRRKRTGSENDKNEVWRIVIKETFYDYCKMGKCLF